MRVWYDHDPKKGTRFVSQTKNPKTGKWNAPKPSTYQDLRVAKFDAQGHLEHDGVSMYSDAAQVSAFLSKYQHASPDTPKLQEAALRIQYSRLRAEGKSHAEAAQATGLGSQLEQERAAGKKAAERAKVRAEKVHTVRQSLEDAIAAKLPRDAKKGRGADRMVWLGAGHYRAMGLSGDEAWGRKKMSSFTDEQIGKLADHFKLKHNLQKGEVLVGGRADGAKPQQFPRRALAEGTRHEMEHTNNRRAAREIAMDHLAERPDYYERLKQLEKGAPMDTSGTDKLRRLAAAFKVEGYATGGVPATLEAAAADGANGDRAALERSGPQGAVPTPARQDESPYAGGRPPAPQGASIGPAELDGLQAFMDRGPAIAALRARTPVADAAAHVARMVKALGPTHPRVMEAAAALRDLMDGRQVQPRGYQATEDSLQKGDPTAAPSYDAQLAARIEALGPGQAARVSEITAREAWRGSVAVPFLGGVNVYQR